MPAAKSYFSYFSVGRESVGRCLAEALLRRDPIGATAIQRAAEIKYEVVVRLRILHADVLIRFMRIIPAVADVAAAQVAAHHELADVRVGRMVQNGHSMPLKHFLEHFVVEFPRIHLRVVLAPFAGRAHPSPAIHRNEQRNSFEETVIHFVGTDKALLLLDEEHGLAFRQRVHERQRQRDPGLVVPADSESIDVQLGLPLCVLPLLHGQPFVPVHVRELGFLHRVHVVDETRNILPLPNPSLGQVHVSRLAHRRRDRAPSREFQDEIPNPFLPTRHRRDRQNPFQETLVKLHASSLLVLPGGAVVAAGAVGGGAAPDALVAAGAVAVLLRGRVVAARTVARRAAPFAVFLVVAVLVLARG